MKRHWWGAGLALGAIFGTACSIEDLDEAEAAADDGVVEFRDFSGVTDEVCPAWRQVVRRNDGLCTDITGTAYGGKWVGSKMLAADAPGIFGKYCVYEYDPSDSPNPTHVENFQDLFPAAAADCLVVQPEGLIEDLNPALRALTVDRLDLVDTNEIDFATTKTQRAPVHVAAVDTTPLLPPSNPRSDHGLAVATLIRDVSYGCASPGPGCAVAVMNLLGMPRYGFGRNDRDPTNGGYAGFQSETARGLYNAMRNWELAQTPSYQPKLVVNLSLGWLPDFGGGSPAVDAFDRVLERLSCRGALVIAAAGNDRDDCVNGPMIPAAWEAEAAPDAAACSAVGVANPVTSPAAYEPLVHSVGALGFDDEPIALSREGGRPRIAALGESVVGPLASRGPLTGTSMSAAAVSGMAALVWSYNPSLTSHEVAREIWQAGIDTGDFSDYGLGSAKKIRRVTACRALAGACAETEECPPSFDLACRTTDLPTTGLEQAVAAVEPDHTTVLAVDEVGVCSSYCSETYDYWNVPSVPDVCPVLEGPERTDYLTLPQPDNPGCSACTWVTTNTGTTSQQTKILAQLATQYFGWTVDDVTIDLVLTNSRRVHEELGPQPLNVYGREELTIEHGPTVGIRSGTITLTVTSPSGAQFVNSDPLVRGTAL